MLVRCRDVTKRFDTTVAVRCVTMDVPRGGLVGVVGPNGAGKTSLLRMIATLAKPDVGSIEVDGIDVVEDPGRVRRMIGYMPAEFGKFPEMSVEEYLRYFAAAHGVERSERARRVEDVLQLTDLVPRRDEPVSAGSTGIKQRVLIAKTLVHDPELLLLDEPSAGLDPRARIEVREVLKELNRIGKTILLSSHILADLEEICDRITIFERGAVVVDGNLEDLRAQQKDARSRTFVVEVPAELLERALATIAARPDALEARAEGQIRIRFKTKDGASANGILGALVLGEIEVRRFVEESPRLEDVFLHATKGGLTP
jgi:ABC-2 type transport system ATP-binding protein